MASALLRTVLQAVLGVSLLVASGSCDGTPTDPTPDPLQIGPGGGTLQTADGAVSLVIPPGALAQPVAFSIRTTTAHPAGAVGPVFEIGPSGTQFNPAATLRIRVPGTLPEGITREELRIATVQNGSWSAVETTWGATSGTLSAAIPHLSMWGVVSAFQTEPVTCPDLRFSVDRATPFDTVEITGLPDGFGTYLAARILLPTGSDLLLTYIERGDDGRVLMQAPIHPEGRRAGGSVRLRLVDDSGRNCQSLPFHVEPIAAAPGTFVALADVQQELIALQAAIFATTPEQLRSARADTVSPYLIPLLLAQQLLDGRENANSLRALAEGTAPFFELASEDRDFAEALLAHSGILEHQRAVLSRLRSNTSTQAATPAPPAAFSTLRTSSALSANSRWCSSDKLSEFIASDAEALFRAMRNAIEADIAVHSDATAYLDAAGLMFGLGGAIGRAGGPWIQLLTSLYGVAGVNIFVFKNMAEAASGLFPSELVSLSFTHRNEFFEDDDPVGTWEQATVVARSKGWNVDKAVFDAIMQALAVKGTSAKGDWLNRFLPTESIREFSVGIFDVLLNEVVTSTVNTDSFQIPTCDYTVDVSDERWSEASILDEAGAPVVMTGHQSYEARATGTAYLHVRTREMKFGYGQTIGKTEEIKVLPIEIEIQPAAVQVEPGASPTFTATVKNARDSELQWSITPRESHHVVIVGSTHHVGVYTSENTTSFPAVLRARSVSTGGLRGRNGAPERFAEVVISINQFSLEPDAACIRVGETLQFSAQGVSDASRSAAAASLQDGGPVEWTASAGTITSSGLFTAPSAPATVVVTASFRGRRETAVLNVARDCRCWWTMEIGGGISEIGSGSYAEFAPLMGWGALSINLLPKNLYEDLENGDGEPEIPDMFPNVGIHVEWDQPRPDTIRTLPAFMYGMGVGIYKWQSAETARQVEEIGVALVTVDEKEADYLEGRARGRVFGTLADQETLFLGQAQIAFRAERQQTDADAIIYQCRERP